MFRSYLGFIVLLGAAVSVPYVASEWRQFSSKLLNTDGYTARSPELQETLARESQHTGETIQGTQEEAEQIRQNVYDSAQRVYAQPVSQQKNKNGKSNAENDGDGSYAANQNESDSAKYGSANSNLPNGGNVQTVSNGQPTGPLKIDDYLPGTRPNELSLVRLDEALAWEVTIPWVLKRWQRVNTSIVEDDLRGFRVPLVTGTTEEDLAGALTYYFNKENRCTRLTLHATVGDPRGVTMYLVRRFGFEPKKSDEAGTVLYQLGYNGKAKSQFTIKPAQVVRASTPHLRYQLELEMYRK